MDATFREIPVVKGGWLPGRIRRSLDFQDDPYDYLKRMVAEYGQVFKVVHQFGETLWVLEPELVRQLFYVKGASDKGGGAYDSLRRIFTDAALTIADNQQHLVRRQMLAKSYGLGGQGNHAVYQQIIDEEITALIEKWRGKTGIIFDPTEDIENANLNIIIRLMCGSIPEQARTLLPELLKTIVQYMMIEGVAGKRIADWYAGSAVNELKAQLNALLLSLVKSPNSEGKLYLIDHLYQYVVAEKLSMEAMVEETMVVLMAGYETVTRTLTYLLQQLGNHVDVADRIYWDILSARANGISEAEILNLTFIDQTVNETGRLFAPIPMTPRQSLIDLIGGGYFIPAGSVCTIYAQYMQRHPDIWAEPDRFWPDRQIPSNAIDLTFSAGARYCPGQVLAVLQEKYLIVRLLEAGMVIRPEVPTNDVPIAYGTVLYVPEANRRLSLSYR